MLQFQFSIAQSHLFRTTTYFCMLLSACPILTLNMKTQEVHTAHALYIKLHIIVCLNLNQLIPTVMTIQSLTITMLSYSKLFSHLLHKWKTPGKRTCTARWQTSNVVIFWWKPMGWVLSVGVWLSMQFTLNYLYLWLAFNISPIVLWAENVHVLLQSLSSSLVKTSNIIRVNLIFV